MKTFRSLMLFAGALSLFTAMPHEAEAHAVPLIYSPKAGQTELTEAPAFLEILFTEHIAESASSIAVFSPSGERLDAGPAETDRNDTHKLRVPIREGGEGTYAVSWQVVSSDDGHFTKGAYSFSIGTPSTAIAENETVAYTVTPFEVIAIWIELLGAALLLGALALQWVTKERLEKSRLFLFGSFFVLLGSGGYLLDRICALSESLSIPFAEGAGIFIGTYPGGITAGRVGVSIILFVLIVSFRKKKLPYIIPAAGALLLVLGRAMVSHSAASHFLPKTSIAINFIHLLFKDLWIGGALALALLARDKFIEVNRRFTRLASLALAVGGSTGAYIVWLHLKSLGELFDNTWGRLFSLMFMLALPFAFFRFLPVFYRGFSEKRLRHFTYGEALIGALILGITSILILTTPPLHRLEGWHAEARDEGVRFAMSGGVNRNLFSLTLSGEAPDAEVLLLAEQRELGIGPIEVPLMQKEGAYTFPASTLSPPGRWQLSAIVRQEGSYDARAEFTLLYPEDATERRADEKPRTFDAFAMFSILAALFLLGAGAWMFKRLVSLKSQ